MIGLSGITGDFKGLPFLTWRVTKHASSAFTGATASAHGEISAANTYRVFTVTGVVAIKALIGVVNVSLTNATSNISLGITGSIALWANADDAPSWVGGDIIGGGGAAGATQHANTALISVNFANGEISIIDGADIVETVDTADVNAGQIDYYTIWAPMEAGASVVGTGTLSQV